MRRACADVAKHGAPAIVGAGLVAGSTLSGLGLPMSPIALTDCELDRVMRAAALLSPSRRDGFLRSVANRLSLAPGGVDEAIAFVLAGYDVSMDPRALG